MWDSEDKDTSYLRVGVLPQDSFKLTTIEGEIPSTGSRPSAPPALAAVLAQWCEVSRQTSTASPEWARHAGAWSPPCRRLR
jgi:hypothetical protein